MGISHSCRLAIVSGKYLLTPTNPANIATSLAPRRVNPIRHLVKTQNPMEAKTNIGWISNHEMAVPTIQPTQLDAQQE